MGMVELQGQQGFRVHASKLLEVMTFSNQSVQLASHFLDGLTIP